MFTALLPKGAPFFELLLRQNAILCTVAASTASMLEVQSDADKQHREISLLEAEADSIYQTVTKHLSQTFITPIDREDLLHINKAQEEAIDLFFNMSNRLFVFGFTRIRFPLLQLARILQEMASQTRYMLEGLSERRDCHNTKAFRALRNECEMLLSIGIAELHDIKDPTPENLLSILKWSQAYDRMELTVNQIVELAETLEEAVLKNA